MRLILAGLAGLSLSLAASAGMAQTSPAPAAAPAPAAPPPAKASVDSTTIADLMANPATMAVLKKDLPELLSDPRIEQAKGMTLKEVEPYSEGKIDDAKLADVQKDLDAAKGP
ncbi:MAG: hypothetical protein ABI306_06785 [Caulobacteraceae bacterium]